MLEGDVQRLVANVSADNDMASFEKLYYFYYGRLLRIAHYYLHSREKAEETVNDTFIAVWTNRNRLTEIENFTFYIFKVLKNKCFTLLNTDSSYRRVDFDKKIHDLVDQAPNKEEQLQLDDLNGQLKQAIADLPYQCGVVFKLVKQDGFKHKEAAEILNLSVRTVEYHISTALKKISESLQYIQNKANV